MVLPAAAGLTAVEPSVGGASVIFHFPAASSLSANCMGNHRRSIRASAVAENF
eukprot:CAMPEP_0182942332 /NCGR_PEP_ID=MMETSP0105_2-20130417/50494_1 /TAXON_ID=81532 ORGANISM="Acanthoeca-like sp., Strain 10tr" /NCGR_SAMPLE_ID=MMETSP0105_2 /ASSEMBLY_ACC=CAM_ASM_000205 /LENGTH=52 /DNA_ID=CAMNT_0025082047 /DNA_START=76 /DNA_END=231 /DNA_ORIENTATION=+